MTRETRNGLLAFIAVAVLAVAVVNDAHRTIIAAVYPHMFEIYKFLFWN